MSLSDIVQKVKRRKIQKKLIKSDDETVIQSLTEDLQDLEINMPLIVANMENPKKMAELVETNLDKIIQQDNVKDTLKYLKDEDIHRILEEKQKVLKEQQKIIFAILSIKENQRKLKVTNKNLNSLTDFEVQRIFQSLKPETQVDKIEEMENRKIEIVGKKIFENIKKYGTAHHLMELTESL